MSDIGGDGRMIKVKIPLRLQRRRGRKVIDGIKDRLGLTEEELRHSRSVLREFGNMSSPTVLFVLDRMLRDSSPEPGDLGVMLAMGPGLAIEGALLEW